MDRSFLVLSTLFGVVVDVCVWVPLTGGFFGMTRELAWGCLGKNVEIWGAISKRYSWVVGWFAVCGGGRGLHVCVCGWVCVCDCPYIGKCDYPQRHEIKPIMMRWVMRNQNN